MTDPSPDPRRAPVDTWIATAKAEREHFITRLGDELNGMEREIQRIRLEGSRDDFFENTTIAAKGAEVSRITTRLKVNTERLQELQDIKENS